MIEALGDHQGRAQRAQGPELWAEIQQCISKSLEEPENSPGRAMCCLTAVARPDGVHHGPAPGSGSYGRDGAKCIPARDLGSADRGVCEEDVDHILGTDKKKRLSDSEARRGGDGAGVHTGQVGAVPTDTGG